MQVLLIVLNTISQLTFEGVLSPWMETKVDNSVAVSPWNFLMIGICTSKQFTKMRWPPRKIPLLSAIPLITTFEDPWYVVLCSSNFNSIGPLIIFRLKWDTQRQMNHRLSWWPNPTFSKQESTSPIIDPISSCIMGRISFTCFVRPFLVEQEIGNSSGHLGSFVVQKTILQFFVPSHG